MSEDLSPTVRIMTPADEVEGVDTVVLAWHLPMIGVDPAHQGQGHGNALMTHALERCDRDHLPAYLESTNPRNMTLYLRHGFEPLGTISVGGSPPIVPMLRAPR